MGNEQLATQSELGAFNEALALLAENLSFHVNQAVDLGHGGVSLVKGYVDSDGNDLRTYQDSAGHIYSNTDVNAFNFLRFVVGGQPYFAPVQNTSLEGKEETTGALSDTDDPSDEPTETVLIPEFVSLESQAAVNTNSLLLEHTQKEAQSAHLAVTALSSAVLDSNGDTVGASRIRLQLDNYLWEIPADPRLGGPWQPPRITNNARWFNNGTSWFVDSPKDTGWPYTVYANISAEGGAPLSYRWQVKDSGGSNDFEDLNISGAYSNPYGFGIIYADANTDQLVITDQNIPNNSTKVGYLRCKITNSYGGTTYTTYSRTLTLSITDHTGCWICSAFWQARREAQLPAKIYEVRSFPLMTKLVKAFLRHNREMARFYLKDCGPLIENMRAQNYNFLQLGGFNESILTLMKLGQVDAAVQLYLHTIIDLISEYWPDCDHPTWLKYRHLEVPLANFAASR